MTSTMSPLATAILGCFLLSCVMSDLRTRRISNALTAGGMVAGLLLAVSTHGANGLLTSLAGILLAIVVLVGPFALGGIGGATSK